MKVEIDATRCQGHNRCMVLAPEIFEVDDLGFARVRDPGSQVPADFQEAVRRAVGSCPEFAITLTQE